MIGQVGEAEILWRRQVHRSGKACLHSSMTRNCSDSLYTFLQWSPPIKHANTDYSLIRWRLTNRINQLIWWTWNSNVYVCELNYHVHHVSVALASSLDLGRHTQP